MIHNKEKNIISWIFWSTGILLVALSNSLFYEIIGGILIFTFFFETMKSNKEINE